jgi:hypothetical protein
MKQYFTIFFIFLSCILFAQNDSIVSPLDTIFTQQIVTQDSTGNYIITETNFLPDSTQSSNVRTLSDSIQAIQYLNLQIKAKTEAIQRTRSGLQGSRRALNSYRDGIRTGAVLLDLYKKQRIKLIEQRQLLISG